MRAHESLGNPVRNSGVLEEYPLSGVTLWFDPEGRVSKMSFHGPAGAIYAGSGSDWIPSDRTIIFGLTARAADLEFARVLGAPVTQRGERSSAKREIRRIWRKSGYLIDALFLASDRVEGGRTFPRGTLLWFELSRGL